MVAQLIVAQLEEFESPRHPTMKLILSLFMTWSTLWPNNLLGVLIWFVVIMFYNWIWSCYGINTRNRKYK